MNLPTVPDGDGEFFPLTAEQGSAGAKEGSDTYVHTEVTTVAAFGGASQVAAHFVFCCHRYMTTSLKRAGISMVATAE